MRLAAVAIAACLAAPAQPQFEAASIKPASGRMRPRGPASRSAQTTYSGLTLKDLVFRAYGVAPYQLRTPAWMDSGAQFDIVAKMPAGAAQSDVPAMLRALLEQRFHLKVHHESQTAPAYALTLGKDGVRMTEHPAALPPGAVDGVRVTGVDAEGVYIIAPGYVTGIMGSQNGVTTISMALQTTGDLGRFLSRLLRAPVVDQTGLAGRYDARMKFATPAESLPPPTPAEESAELTAPLPSLFDAVQKLGLKLAAKKLAVDFLVVDSADRQPTEN